MDDLGALDLVPCYRVAALDRIEMGETEEGFSFQGHAAVFDHEADMGDFSESIARGSFSKVLASAENIPLLHEHRPDQLLATTGSGRLRLAEDERGLKVSASLVKTDLSQRVKALVDSGDMKGMSFGFIAGAGNSKIERRAGKPHRLITNFKKLLDVTTTWSPAYAQTSAEFRSLVSMGSYDHPLKQRPRSAAEIALQLDRMAVELEAEGRRLKELGL